MDCDEKNVCEDQQRPITQESVSQNEDLSPDEMITSSLQAGINYCRCMADQMSEEIKSLQEKWDSIRQTNRVLMQNLVDLENEKQRLISNFQEEFRKFNSLNSCVKGLEEEILSLEEFLDASMKLENDVSQSRIEELKIRTTIQNLLEEQETKWQKIESSIQDCQNKLEKKINEVQVFEAEKDLFNNIGNQLKSLVQNFDAKIKDLSSNNSFLRDTEEIKKSIDSLQKECKAQATSVEIKREEIPTQVEREIDLLRSRHVFLKDKIKNEFSAKQNILEGMKTNIANKCNRTVELDNEITIRKDAVHNLKNIIESNQKELHNFEYMLHTLKQEENKVKEVLDSLAQEIQILKEEQSNFALEKNNLQTDISQFEIKQQTIRKNVIVMKDKIDLNRKLSEIRSMEVLSRKENEELEKEKEQLLIKEGNLETENANLIREISKGKQRIFELQEIPQKNIIAEVLANEEESELIDQLRFMKTEEYSVKELKELESEEIMDKFVQIFSNFCDLEFSFSQVQQDNKQIETEIRSKQKMLKIISENNESLKNSIEQIKQNVYSGTFITMQSLNKRYNLMVNGKNVEIERVDKLKHEITNLKAQLNSKMESSVDEESYNRAIEKDFSSKAKKSKK